MAGDVQQYCQQCNTCQTSKLPSPIQVPLHNVPIEMLAVDILGVPISHKNHCYILVIMDYFTKWVDAISLRDQTAVSMSDAIIKLCSTVTLGFQQSYTLIKVETLKLVFFLKCCKPLASRSQETRPTIPKEMEWLNVLTVLYCKC